MKTSFVLLVSLMGCYSYREIPSGTQLPIGKPLQVTLTDEGRVAVKAMAGPGVDQVQGILDSAATTSLVMRVSAVRRNGDAEHWTGEPLVIPAVNVSSVSVRQFDALRTVGLGVAAVALGVLARPNGIGDITGGGKTSGGSSAGR